MKTEKAASANLQPPRSIPRGITSASEESRVSWQRPSRHGREGSACNEWRWGTAQLSIPDPDYL